VRNGAKADYRPRQAWTTSTVTQVPLPELEPPEEPDEPEPPVLPEPEPADPPELPDPPEPLEPEVPPGPEPPAPEPPDPPVPAPDVPPEPAPEPELRPAPEPPVPELPELEPELEPEAGRELVSGALLPDPELVLPEPEPVAWLTAPELREAAEPAEAEADLVPTRPGSTELVASSPAEPALPSPVSEPGAVAPGVSAAGLPWAAADPPWAEGRERCPVPPLAGRPATPPGDAGTWPACGAEAAGPCTSPPMTGA
jgi:hypothetical protein